MSRDEFYRRVGLPPPEMSEAVTADTAGSVLSEESQVAIPTRPDDPSSGSVTSPPDQHRDELLAELRRELSEEREKRERFETRLSEEGVPSSELRPDQAPIEAASVERMTEPTVEAPIDEPRQPARKRQHGLSFPFLDWLFGPDPE